MCNIIMSNSMYYRLYICRTLLLPTFCVSFKQCDRRQAKVIIAHKPEYASYSDNDVFVGKQKKKRSKVTEEEEEDEMNPVLEHRKRQFPGLCIADNPKQAEQMTKDVNVAQQAMGEVG